MGAFHNDYIVIFAAYQSSIIIVRRPVMKEASFFSLNTQNLAGFLIIQRKQAYVH